MLNKKVPLTKVNGTFSYYSVKLYSIGNLPSKGAKALPVVLLIQLTQSCEKLCCLIILHDGDES